MTEAGSGQATGRQATGRQATGRQATGRQATGRQTAVEQEALWGDGTDDGYRGPQVCKIVGITYRQLDYWARTDLIRPSVADAHGSGTQRRYSYRDLVELKVIKSLLDAGVSLQSARRGIEYLRTNLGEDIASASLVLDGARSVLARTDGEIVDLVRRGQGVLNIVPLGGVVGEIDAAITHLRPAGEPTPAAGASESAEGAPRTRAGGG
ncbi:MAG: MerR family transcriptional regulator [Acidimicrobiales bacterium]